MQYFAAMQAIFGPLSYRREMLPWPSVLSGIKTRLKEAQNRWLIGEAQAAQFVAPIIEPGDPLRGIFQMALNVNSRGNRQPHQLKLEFVVFAADFISASGYSAALYRKHAGFDVDQWRTTLRQFA